MSIGQALVAPEMHALIVERDEAVAELQRAKDGVTVCITTHDDPQTMRSAIYSALCQTIEPYEVIVIDDGSAVPFTYRESKPDGVPVRVVPVTNRGLPAARNVGLMLAKTEAIIFLDADDTIRPTFIEKTLPLFPDADVVLVGLQEHGPTRNGEYLPGYDRPFDQVTLEMEFQMNRFFYCALLRVSTMREIGGYNPLMAGPWNQGGGYEDHDVWCDLMSRGARFAAVNETLLDYSTASTDSMVHRAERNREALTAEMKRHHRRS